jgi:IS30 family transposase
MLIKVQGKDTASVVSALSKNVRKLPLELRRSLTWDRGKEMADHKNFTIAVLRVPSPQDVANLTIATHALATI